MNRSHTNMTKTNWLRLDCELARHAMSEFFSTFVLVVGGRSAVAAIDFSSADHDQLTKLLASAIGVGLSSYTALSIAMPVSAGFVNPAVTLAMATVGLFPWTRVLVYLAAQYAGGFLAASVIYLTFYDAITLQLSTFESGSLKGLAGTTGYFVSRPAEHATIAGSFASSFVAAAVFLIGVSTIVDKRQGHVQKPRWFQPLSVAFVVMAIVLAFSHNGGPSINPAADIGPRLFASLIGWRHVVWSCQNGWYWLTTGLVAPHLGAISGVWLYKLFITNHYDERKDQYQLIN